MLSACFLRAFHTLPHICVRRQTRGRISPTGEYTLALRLKNKLFELRAGYANSAPLRFPCGAEFVRPWVAKTKRTPQRVSILSFFSVHTAAGGILPCEELRFVYKASPSHFANLPRAANSWENLPRLARLPTRKQRGRDSNSAPLRFSCGAEFVRPWVAKTKRTPQRVSFCFGDSWENRTPVSALRGPCLSRLTNEPYLFCSIIVS